MEWILLIAGLAALFVGGEALVRGAVGIARRLAIPPLLIGLTVVGFGTSTPELLVSVDAALRGVPDIAIGNIIGSNIGNILLILGLAALIWPIRIMGDTLRRDTAVMMGAALVLLPAFWPGELGRPAGLALVAGLVGFLLLSFLRPGSDQPAEDDAPPPRLWLSLIWVAAGLAALMLGARWLVDGATTIARDLGLSEAFIGLSIVAIGTSLPELATSLVAALRRQSEIAIGNIVGSNIFNVLGILGITAVIQPIPVADRFLTLDLPVMIAVSALLTVLLMRPRIGRLTGLGLLAGYAAYVWVAMA
ncbi:sodium:calcium antiporter [Paracoccus sp. (in: a-proteobacteria)]|uniref:sodium:calcium antiporter n=1 Tax=Paracoccus sp. TaxID=267 RepID=UPI00272A06B1|nr:sodium:calcium antiporter [Paracoccus sp. (in: a-proteobacteria)]